MRDRSALGTLSSCEPPKANEAFREVRPRAERGGEQ
jgi:hypothetical protein